MSLLPARRRSAAILWWFLPLIAVGGWFYPYLGYALLACMLAPVVVGAFRGRHWCGWLCPRGAFFDYLMARASPGRRAPAWLRGTPFRLGVMALVMTVMGVQIVRVWPDFAAVGGVLVLLLGVTTVAGIALALAYSPRTWCTFCPMGTMARWVSHGKNPLRVDAACRNCGVCARACPMGLTPHQPGPDHADCIKCGQCAARCPITALSFGEKTTDEVAKAA